MTCDLLIRSLSLQIARYFVLAGGSFVLFWIILRDTYTQAHRIQEENFSRRDIAREILFSVSTCLIFGFTIYASTLLKPVGPCSSLNLSSLLQQIEPSKLLLLVLIYDSYFYWTHRAFHRSAGLFRFHRIHHQSHNPSPFTSLSFHPIEAIVHVIWAIPAYVLLPINLGTWLAFMLTTTLVNVLGHSGVEILPYAWRRHPILKYLNFPTEHNNHHLNSSKNYGLYFSFWDRACNTLSIGRRRLQSP